MYQYGYASQPDPGMAIAILLVSLALAFLYLISWCKLFHKAGLPWERLFVPVYGTYWMYKFIKSTGIFWTTIFACIAMPFAVALLGPEVGGIVSILIMLVLVIITCVYYARLAKAFGKGGGFAFGLIILNPIFLPILAFGQSKYIL